LGRPGTNRVRQLLPVFELVAIAVAPGLPLISTATASRAMGLDKQVGTIEKGKDADLVIVAGDPSKDVANFRKVRYVVRSGVVRSIVELSAVAK